MKEMMLKNRFLIGEFAERTGVSKRMLRHYDEIGLLAPAEVDGTTGYRYYGEDLEERVHAIQMLTRLGFSLKETLNLFNGTVDADEFLQMLKSKEAELRISIDQDTGILLRIRKIIDRYGTQSPLNQNLTESLFHMDEKQIDKRSCQMEKKNTHIRTVLNSLPGSDLFFEQIDQITNSVADVESDWSFITFDIDKFLKVNDEYGYDTGDKVIFTVLKNILDVFPPLQNGVLASRLGGDEMGIFITSIDEEEIKSKVKSVIDNIARFDFGTLGCPIPITISAGIYRTKEVSHRVELRHNSTKALLEAKRQGGNCYYLMN